jgi:hypothetical protein
MRGSSPARAIGSMNMADKPVVGSRSRGIFESLPAAVRSNSACRIGHNSGVIGTIRTARPSWAAAIGLRKVIRSRS